MFKNRTIELRVKKDKKDETNSNEPAPTVEELSATLTANALALISIGGKNVMKMVAAYVALDTARKIAVGRYGK